MRLEEKEEVRDWEMRGRNGLEMRGRNGVGNDREEWTGR